MSKHGARSGLPTGATLDDIKKIRFTRKPYGCWESPVKIGRHGKIRIKGKVFIAYRALWEALFNVVIPAGLVLAHRCDNRRCVNVSHLFLTTQQINMKDRDSKKRGSQSRKTHCPNGHEYTEENTYRHPRGDRQCKKCVKHRNDSRKNH